MHDPIGSGISSDDVALRIDAIGIGMGSAGKINLNAILAAHERSVNIAVGRAKAAHHLTLGIQVAEKCKGRAGAINRLKYAVKGRESVGAGTVEVATHKASGGGHGRKTSGRTRHVQQTKRPSCPQKAMQ